MASVMIFSQIERSPLAPSLFSIEVSTIRSNTSGSMRSFMPSSSNIFSYWRIIAFLGSVRILSNAALSKLSNT